MKGGKQQGYTIIEVLLFVAISGFMFVVAAIFINGKQSQVEFRQGMNSTNATVESIVNEVANGEYNSLSNASGTTSLCETQSSGPPIFTSGTNAQGANNGCIFLGKVFQPDIGGDPTTYNTYTVVARQLDSATQSPVNTFASALPLPVAKINKTDPTPDLTVNGNFQSGLQITKMRYCASNDVDCNGPNSYSIGAIGMFGSFTSYNASTASAEDSGAQSITVVALPWIPFGETKTNAVSEMNTKLSSLDPTPSADYIIGGGSYVLLCLQNGTKTGDVTIGGDSGQQFNTAMRIGGGPKVCLS